jgi:hypothetical protein
MSARSCCVVCTFFSRTVKLQMTRYRYGATGEKGCSGTQVFVNTDNTGKMKATLWSTVTFQRYFSRHVAQVVVALMWSEVSIASHVILALMSFQVTHVDAPVGTMAQTVWFEYPVSTVTSYLVRWLPHRNTDTPDLTGWVPSRKTL